MIRRLNILHRLHGRMLDIVAAGLPLLTSSMRDADLIGLTYLRGEMIEVLAAYARHVRELETDAEQMQDPDRVRLAGEIVRGCTALHRSYEAFRNRWAHRDGQMNWPEYRLSAIVMMKQIRDQVRTSAQWESAETRVHERAG